MGASREPAKSATKSAAASKPSVTADLPSEWDMDFFETYEVNIYDGLVNINSTCPEGDEMNVTVSEVKKRSPQGPNSSESDKSKVYHVLRTTIDYHNDPRGGIQDTGIVGVFNSLDEANQAAREDLLNEWSRDFFESYEVEEDEWLVTVTAECPEGEEMTVSVVEGELNPEVDEDSDEYDEDSEEFDLED